MFTDKDFIDFKNLQAATLSSQSRIIVSMSHAWYGTIMVTYCLYMYVTVYITDYYTHSLDTVASTSPVLQTMKVTE